MWPRLDLSALISELCESDGETSSSVLDIYTGLNLDGAQVEAAREVKRMLQFDVCEEVSEEFAGDKKIWNSSSLDLQKKVGLVRSRLVVCTQNREHVCGHDTPCSCEFHDVACCVSWSWPLPWAVGCACGILPRSD